MKREEIDVGAFVEKRLDQISELGDWVGKNLGGLGRGARNVIIGAGVLVIFGAAAFLWALGKGLLKKK